MRVAFLLLVATVSGLATADALAGQVRTPPGGTRFTKADSVAVATLRPGDRLLIDLGAAGRFEGRYLAGDGGSLKLEVDGGRREVDLVDVARIWARGPSTERGVWIGLMSGFATGLVAGIGLSAVGCDPYDSGNCRTWQVAAAYGGLGAVSGAVIGGVVGRLISSWRLLIPG